MKKIILNSSLMLLLGLFLVGTAQTENLKNFSHQARIKAEGKESFFHFPLTLEVYQNSLSPQLSDLRIFNAAGEMVPHALTVKTDIPQATVQQFELKNFPLYSDETSENRGIRIRREKNGELVSIDPAKPTVTRKLTGVILDASKIKVALTSLDISLTEYKQPFQHFRIESSDDLKDWRTVQNSATITVLEQDGERIEQRRVELPAIRVKYLRLTWLDPQTISGQPKVTVSSSTLPQYIQPELLWSASISPSRNAKGEYLYQFGNTLPVEQIRFILPQINTLVPAQLFLRNNEKQHWRRVSNTVLYRLSSNGNESVSPDINLGGQAISELQLKLDTRAGGIGEQPLQAKIAVRPQELIFLARGEGPFTLAWGMNGAKSNTLPLSTLIPGYRYQNSLPGNPAMLESNTKNPAINKADSKEFVSEADQAQKNKWVLWGVLIAGAVVLLLMAVKLLRSDQSAAP